MASVLADIEMLASAGDFASLARHCEAFELDLRHTEEPQPVSVAVYKVHLLAYLLTEQVDAARFLWKRMPAGTHALDPELAAIWEVGKQMWQKQPAGVQAALRSVPWSQPLVASLAARLQADTLQSSFKQMGAAYNTVAAPVLAQRLGVEEARVHELAAAAGWVASAETGLYAPCAPAEDKQRTTGLEQLQALTEYVGAIEHEVR